jgi:hypothetical protein
MATTTVTLSIASADLTTDALSLSATKTLYNAGTSTGMSQVEGVAKKFLAGDATNPQNYVIGNASVSKFTAGGATKIYIKNTSTVTSDYLTVIVGEDAGASDGTYTGQELGRLYGGDFLFIPWSAVTTSTPDSDIIVQTPANSLNQEVEYLIIFE